MARSRVEIATDFLSEVGHARQLASKAEQATMMSDEDKLKLCDALIDNQASIERLFEEYEGRTFSDGIQSEIDA